MNWRRLSSLFCAANWLAFALFLATRPPHIDARYEVEMVEGTTTFSPMGSGQAKFHIAGRPVHDWNSWHGGEAPLVKVLELANYPSLTLARSIAPSLSRLLFGRVVSYYLESWVLAWLFFVAATMQWIGIGWLIGKIALPRSVASG